MASGKWFVRIWKSGGAVDMSKYYVAANQRPRSSQKKGASTVGKKDKNGGQAARRLARILNANFGRGDYLLTLKYDEAGLALVGADYDRGEKAMMLFLRRLAYRFKKRGIKIRYVGCTSEKADRTLEAARLHHHIVISGELISKQEGGGYLLAGEPIEAIWGLGSVDLQEFRQGEADHTGLAVYLCRQARCLPDEKRWHPSRGLLKPRWQDVEATAEGIREYNRHRPKGMPRLIVTADGELAAPPKCAMVEKGPYMPALGSHYIRFLLPEAVGIAPEVPPEKRRRKRKNGAPGGTQRSGSAGERTSNEAARTIAKRRLRAKRSL